MCKKKVKIDDKWCLHLPEKTKIEYISEIKRLKEGGICQLSADQERILEGRLMMAFEALIKSSVDVGRQLTPEYLTQGILPEIRCSIKWGAKI